MKLLGILPIIAFGFTVTSMIQATVLGKIWAWFAAAEYGSGPSKGAWFGISIILGLIISMSQSRNYDIDGDFSYNKYLKHTVIRWAGQWIGCACLLGLCWFTGSIFGWLH